MKDLYHITGQLLHGDLEYIGLPEEAIAEGVPQDTTTDYSQYGPTPVIDDGDVPAEALAKISAFRISELSFTETINVGGWVSIDINSAIAQNALIFATVERTLPDYSFNYTIAEEDINVDHTPWRLTYFSGWLNPVVRGIYLIPASGRFSHNVVLDTDIPIWTTSSYTDVVLRQDGSPLATAHIQTPEESTSFYSIASLSVGSNVFSLANTLGDFGTILRSKLVVMTLNGLS